MIHAISRHVNFMIARDKDKCSSNHSSSRFKTGDFSTSRYGQEYDHYRYNDMKFAHIFSS